MNKIKRSLIFAMLLFPLFSLAQDLQISPKVFSLRNSKLSFGVGLEYTYPTFMSSIVKTSDLKVQYKDARNSDDQFPYLAGGIAFDLYSDNSLIGLLWGANYTLNTSNYEKENHSIDYFEVERVEFPAYLKFRPGKVGGKEHFWLLFGGIYSLPVAVKREHDTNVFSSKDQDYIDEDKSQTLAFLSLSTSLGYEFYFSDQKTTRGALFVTGTYPLTNQFNSNYKEFGPGGRSVFANYPGFDARDLRISIGIKVLYKLSKNKI